MRVKTKTFSADRIFMLKNFFERRFTERFIELVAVAGLAFFVFSCKTVPVQEEISREIAGYGIKSAEQLTEFFLDKRSDADEKTVLNLARLYVEEGSFEGINSDVAFVQMCLETGFLKFGNLVQPEWHNYCGLGAIDAAHPGERFETEQLGVRAHIQHLHAYGTSENVKLKNPLVDRRYKYVKPRGKALTVFALSGTWAADRNYGSKLDALLTQLSEY